MIWCGNHDDSHSHIYMMCVVTGWWADAGTSANVYCTVKGKGTMFLAFSLTNGKSICVLCFIVYIIVLCRMSL